MEVRRFPEGGGWCMYAHFGITAEQERGDGVGYGDIAGGVVERLSILARTYLFL